MSNVIFKDKQVAKGDNDEERLLGVVEQTSDYYTDQCKKLISLKHSVRAT